MSNFSYRDLKFGMMVELANGDFYHITYDRYVKGLMLIKAKSIDLQDKSQYIEYIDIHTYYEDDLTSSNIYRQEINIVRVYNINYEDEFDEEILNPIKRRKYTLIFDRNNSEIVWNDPIKEG